jgi:hypothetical protein
LDDGLIDLAPDDEKLHNELMSIKWGVTSTGKIYIESKEDMKDRGVPSPDHADAAAYSMSGITPIQVLQGASELTSDLLKKVM